MTPLFYNYGRCDSIQNQFSHPPLVFNYESPKGALQLKHCPSVTRHNNDYPCDATALSW